MLSVVLRATGLAFVVLLVLSASAWADNDLDPTFAGDGVETTQFPGLSYHQVTDVAIQPDGKVLVVGGVGRPDTAFAVARYTSGGSLDPSFGGGDGLVALQVTPGIDVASGVAIDPGGRIVLGGLIGSGHIGLARLLPDGTPDTSFDGDGTADLDIPGFLTAGRDVALTSSGAIMLAYTVRSDTSSEAASNFGIARFTIDGALDTAYGGGDGFNDFELGANDEPVQIRVLSDGSTIMAGLSRTSATASRLAAAKVDAAGNLDPGFDGDGRLVLDGWEAARSVDLASGGGFLLGAFRTPSVGSTEGAVLSLTAAGALNPAFGTGGAAVLSSHRADLLIPQSVEQAPDGRIAVSGPVPLDGRVGYGAARLLAGGTLDPGYSSDGIAAADIGPGLNAPATGAVQPDSKIVAAGLADQNPAADSAKFGVARFLPNGGPDVGDGGGGGGGTDEAVEGITVDAARRQPQGRRLRVEVETAAEEESVVAAVSGSFKIAAKKGKKGKRAAALGSGKRGGKLKTKRFQLDPGESKTVRLKAARRKEDKRAIRALKKGRKVTAKVKVQLTDDAGNTTTEKATVKLKK